MSGHRPNVLMITLDDMGFWTMGTRGNAEIRTPNIDRLAQGGVDFSNCYCASPVCSPARASLLTGKIPSQHGVIDWIRQGSKTRDGDRPVEYPAGPRGFSESLAENGYFCALIGKWHLGDSARPQKGFTCWTTMPKGSGSYYGARLFRGGEEVVVQDYLTDVLAEEACDLIEARRPRTPRSSCRSISRPRIAPGAGTSTRRNTGRFTMDAHSPPAPRCPGIAGRSTTASIRARIATRRFRAISPRSRQPTPPSGGSWTRSKAPG